MVYLLILIGGIVRATGSGMGCPDWPRCFGLWIPPTQEAQIRFMPDVNYEKGVMVIEHDTLWVSLIKQTGQDGFVRKNWMKYPKHDYAVFNVFQTWTEYLNRLFGALTGLFVFACLLLSIPLLRSKRFFFLLSLFLLLLTGFQGWLGALVVDYHLAPIRITVHMLTAMAMVAVLVMMQHQLQPVKVLSGGFRIAPIISIFALILLVQIVFGTQVRQEVDVWLKGAMEIPSTWSSELSRIFDIHRIVAALLFFFGLVIFNKTAGDSSGRQARNLLMLITAEGLAGMVLSGLSLPNLIQPVHLVISALLFGTTMRLLLATNRVQT